MIEIQQKYTGKVLYSTEAETLRGADLRGMNLTRADLRGADLTDAILRGADLRGADLIDAILTDATLTDANLTDADLTYAKLTEANLIDAILRGADLTGANLIDALLIGANLARAILRRVNLRDADLFGANLTGADLSYANLRGANLARAILTDAILTDADLTDAILSSENLRDIMHVGNPKDLVGGTKPPLCLVPPALVIHTSRAMANGAKKYGAFKWRECPVKLTVYLEAAMRHILSCLDGEDAARDSGVDHTAHVAACVAIILDAKENGNLVDDRPKKGPAADLIERLTTGKS